MFKKIVASDMDGTFLRPDGSYDKERFAALLDKLTEAGYLFVAASGRSLLTLKGLFHEFKDKMAFIAENGCIVECAGQVIFEAEMMPEDYQLILAELRAHPDCQGYLLSGENGAYAALDASDDYIQRANYFYANVQRADLNKVTDKILKVTARFDSDKIHDFSKHLNGRLADFQAVVTGFDGMDIIPKAYDKSTGLAVLCGKLGLSASDVYAFGDNYNDLEMLKFARTAVVPENAVEAAKELAEEVIGDNSTDAVLSYLESLV
ncbi:Cof-type HAD-IIB family hydrolase [Streptococcus thoraltensis]|uniref:Cof-type HAD-IIB family hydrolase n=1 Tax=Streptococcus thoraltensis TaxID=55085 RepID=UPI00039A3BDA|nr:Cof-type HAD-IIB family hydrolase [Streptococcus thoraltensis]MDY4761677.1 Cof-type HAD-IIB family hydrolase [Streptococcus thoraltensis]